MVVNRVLELSKKIRELPQGFTFAVVAVLANALMYALVFLVEIPIIFSYAGNNCVNRPLLLPGIYSTRSSRFDVYASGGVKLGETTLLSTLLCVVPSQAPHEGNQNVSIAPLGGLIGRNTLVIEVPPLIKVKRDTLSKPVPATKNLIISMEQKDMIFSYTLKAKGKTTPCQSQDEAISCDLKALDLSQGVAHDISIDRSFKNKKVDTPLSQTIHTLPAIRFIDSTVKVNETVFSKPNEFELVFDKKLMAVGPIKLYRKEGDKKTEVPIAVSHKDMKIIVALKQVLPRQAEYELVVESIEATDGSGLEDPVTIPFKVSGGPKVVSIDIPKTKVPLGATAVITFDQTLSETQDITKAIKLKGGAAYAAKKGNQLLISLKDVPKCGDFSIEVTDVLQSNYDITGGSAWTFTGRTICHTMTTIGYSVAGRPINAYLFGNGPRAILYTGAIHGNEVGTKYLMERWVQELEANARAIPADKAAIIVPMLNPDGVAAGTRTNRRNVDLNRNFAVSDWQKDITDINNKPFPGGGGEGPMSESETKAIAVFVSQQRPIFVMSYHSIGGVLAANQVGDSITRASMYSQLSGYRNVTGQSAQTFEYSITGTADDWYAEALGIPSVLVELSSHTSAQFERNQKALWRMLNI
jgi:predicted deacylase